MKSLKLKFLLLSLGILILSAFLNVIISTTIMINDKKDELKDRMYNICININSLIYNDFKSFVADKCIEIISDPVFIKYMKDNKESPLIDLLKKQGSFFTEFSILDINYREKIKLNKGEIQGELNAFKNNETLLELNADEQISYLPAPSFSSDGLPAVRVFFKITDESSNIKGYLNTVVLLDKFIQSAKTKDFGYTGFVYLVDSTGTVLYHKNKNNIFKKLEENGNTKSKTVMNIIMKGTGFSRGSLLNIDGYIYYAPQRYFGWMIVATYPYAEFVKPVIYNITFNTTASLVLIIIGALAISLFLNMILKNLHVLKNYVQQISEGNLLLEPMIVNSKDEIGALVTSFNIMLSQLKLMANVSEQIAWGNLDTGLLEKDLKGNLKAAFTQMSFNLREIISKSFDLIENLTIITRQMVVAVEEQKSGITEQASGITEVNATIEELSITAKQIARDSSELVTAGSESIRYLNDSRSTLLKTVIQLDEAGVLSKNNTEQIENLSKRSVLISEMVEIIKQVANKTNILSLNASIEAARAGTAGSGFSIVASEIRALSSETILSAKSVESAAREIKAFINSIIATSEIESEKVLASGKTVKGIYDNLELISSTINNNHTFTQKIEVSVKQQEAGSKQAAETMRQMAQTARQSAETARETMNSINEIVHLTIELENVIKKFNLGTGGQSS